MTITLDISWIALASMNQYTVGVTGVGTITNDWYSKILLSINTRLSKDNLLESDGTLKTGAELLAAYLVCNVIKNGSSDSGLKSESFDGEYSYTRFDSAAAGVTNYLNAYLEEITLWKRGKQASAGIEREDVSIDFSNLDTGVIPSITSTVTEL